MRGRKLARRTVPVLGLLTAACLAPATPVYASAKSPAAHKVKASSKRHTAVLSLHVSPASLPIGGGEASVAAHVSGASTCQLRLISSSGLAVIYSHNKVTCLSGQYSARLIVGPNGLGHPARVAMELVLDGTSTMAIGFAIEVSGGPSPTTTTTAPAPPSSTTTTTPPVGTTTTTGTSTTLPGPTTTTAGPTTTTSGGASTSSTTTPGLPAHTVQPSASLTPGEYHSDNWSGYALLAGPYSAATGTFNVPPLSSGANSNENTSEWVGVDGWSDSNLIQAGIDEEVAAGSGTVDIWPWWEILPAASTPINNLTVSVNDEITVTIWQLSAGQWEISLTDDTTGRVFTTVQSYNGAASSTEWIVEAPENADTNQVYPLAPFMGQVNFSDLGIAGSETSLNDVTLYQGTPPAAVAQPSSFSPTGFSVSYVGTTQGANMSMGPAQLAQDYGHAPPGGTPPLYQG